MIGRMRLISTFILVGCTFANKSSENEEKIEVSEQMDPMFMRRILGQQGPNNITPTSTIPVNFAFTCSCAAKVPNSQAPPPAEASQAAQQQIQQLQEQLRKQQDLINRQGVNKSGFEQFAHLLNIANSMDCSCRGSSNEQSTNQNMNLMGGMGGFEGMNGMTGMMQGGPQGMTGMNGGMNGMAGGMNGMNGGMNGMNGMMQGGPQGMLGRMYPMNEGRLGGVPMTVPFQSQMQPIGEYPPFSKN